MAKKKVEEKELEMVEETSVEVPKLINQTKKYKFEMDHKHGQIYLSVMRKNTSNFHVGTFKFNTIEEIKNSPEVLYFLQLEDVETFFKNFKY